ncbi:ATP-binding protein [Dysgonomonas sp. Marseille-P4677]|uniref:AAA family ATPase n=1 Tax=Dysgonomonas sp. Marseille-P4677 TaxID=2364790 RepID=UPI001911E11C|nr:AAA family ATPase [Dysgonomonas sp. Marseille-P4677]MBK5722771.1 ATP-binding protein [Dysgonomonas sp. Marseille-P4677]
MILSALKYTRYVDEPREWSIVGNGGDYAYFGNINLLVGKNASGKSRTLNVIREIADLVSGRIDLKYAISPSERFELTFTNGEDQYAYYLIFKERAVDEEILSFNNKVILDRKKKILLTAEDQHTPFEVKDYQLAVALHDTSDRPFFKNIVQWGESLKNYLFANQLEKNRLVKDYTQIDGDDHDIDDPDVLIYIFHKGRELYGDMFVSEVIENMQALGYDISCIDIKRESGGYGIVIEEEGEYIVSQREMSQGMFRALALFIMLTYARLDGISLCLLVDDMGEGLDFDSSKKMIDIVTKKVHKSNVQFFMTTNDRQVMNQISLRFWSVIDRQRNKSIFYDYTNSTDTFEDFKYTGLNNFDFLSSDFYKEGFGIINEEND